MKVIHKDINIRKTDLLYPLLYQIHHALLHHLHKTSYTMQLTFSLLGLALGFASAESVSVTPHEQFSSSVGVLGCLIDTNRVAYFPSFPDCKKPCLRLKDKEHGREITVLHIDSSEGAHDISYDAWNYLKTGKSAKDDPQQGNGIEVESEQLSLDDDECKALLKDTDGKLPVMAKSPQWGLECPDNVEFLNIGTATCTTGKDEKCNVSGDQVKCPSGDSGSVGDLKGMTVKNIEYGTGKEVDAQ